MREKLMRDSRVKICILFIAVTFFAGIWYGVFTVNDELVHYVWAQTGDIVGRAWGVATGQGRIMWFVYSICTIVIYVFDSLIIRNLISFSIILFCAYSLWRLLSRHWSRETGFMGVLFYFAFAQADWSHNFFVAYIGVEQGAIAFCLFSLERLLTYYKDRQRKYLIQSALCLLIASSTYESMILYSVLIFFLAILENYPVQLNVKKILSELRFHILFMLIYLAIYFIFRNIYPSQYDANKIGNLDLSAALKTTFVYSVGMFPGTHFFRILKGGVNVLNEIEMLDIVKMILTGAVYVQLVKKAEYKLEIKGKQICYMLIMFMGTILPCILYGFTERHVAWVNNGTTSYGGSYYSYYFWILIFAIFGIWCYQVIKYKRTFLIISTCAVMTVSLMTGISNHYFEDYFKDGFDRYSTFNKLLKSDFFAEIEEDAVIYVEGSSGIHGSFDYVNLLANKYTGRHHEFVTDYEQIDFSKQIYMIKKIHGAWILGQIDAGLRTDKVFVFMEKESDGYSFIGQIEDGQAIYMNGQSVGYYDNTFIVSMTDGREQNAVIEGKKINMENLQMVEEVLENNAIAEFMIQDGFYGKEGDFWWAMNHSVINIKAMDSMRVRLSMDVIASVDTCNLKIVTADRSYDYVVQPYETKVEIELSLDKGDNLVQLICDGEMLRSKEDPREKVIRIFQPDISIL